jgi:hypothetical protein
MNQGYHPCGPVYEVRVTGFGPALCPVLSGYFSAFTAVFSSSSNQANQRFPVSHSLAPAYVRVLVKVVQTTPLIAWLLVGCPVVALTGGVLA